MVTTFFERREIIDKIVVDQSAKILGKVINLGVSNDGQACLVIEDKAGNQVYVTVTNIKKINDVILLKIDDVSNEDDLKVESIFNEDNKTSEQLDEKKNLELNVDVPIENVKEKCPDCGWENIRLTNFCVKCGKDLRK